MKRYPGQLVLPFFVFPRGRLARRDRKCFLSVNEVSMELSVLLTND